jgi:hypothetical protein
MSMIMMSNDEQRQHNDMVRGMGVLGPQKTTFLPLFILFKHTKNSQFASEQQQKNQKEKD